MWWLPSRQSAGAARHRSPSACGSPTIGQTVRLARQRNLRRAGALLPTPVSDWATGQTRGCELGPDRLQRAEAAFAALPFEPRGAGFLLTKAVTTNAAQKATAKVTVKPKAKKYAKVTITKAGKITIKNDRQEEVDPVGPQAPWQVPAGIHTSICMP